MEKNKSAMERAFEIARTCSSGSLPEIRIQLNAEGYGPALRKQILEIAKKARIDLSIGSTEGGMPSTR